MNATATLTRVAVAALAGLTLAVTGCGDGDDRAERPARAGAPSTFLERGNDILCEERHELAGDVIGQVFSGDEPSPDEAGAEYLPAYRAIRDRLASLQPPAGDAAAFAAILDDLGAAIDAADREPSLLLGDDDAFAQVETEMADIGLDGCA
jgi:hypothetical protein